MSKCFCGFLLGILVIVFAWWKVTWGAIALTVLGALIAVKSLAGVCCCETMCKTKEEKQGEEEATQEPGESKE